MRFAPIQNRIAIRLRTFQRGHVTALGDDYQLGVSYPRRDLVRLRWTADQVERAADYQSRALDLTE